MSVDEMEEDNEKHVLEIESLILQAILTSVKTNNMLEIDYWFNKLEKIRS
jgi:hypothetical protein